MTKIVQDFIEGFVSGFKYISEKQLKIVEKVVNHFKSGSAIRSITRFLTIVSFFIFITCFFMMFIIKEFYLKLIINSTSIAIIFSLLGLLVFLYTLYMSVSILKKE